MKKENLNYQVFIRWGHHRGICFTACSLVKLTDEGHEEPQSKVFILPEGEEANVRILCLLGIFSACDFLPEHAKVTFFTDSQYPQTLLRGAVRKNKHEVNNVMKRLKVFDEVNFERISYVTPGEYDFVVKSLSRAIFSARQKIMRDKYEKQFSVFSRDENGQRALDIPVCEPFPPSDDSYIAYTDGSCDNSKRQRPGGAAYIILHKGKIIKSNNKGFLGTTNNRVEILAIISACCSVPEGSYLDVYSDSKYAMGFLSTGFGKRNRDLLDLFRKRCERLGGLRFHWIKGHSGEVYNDLVDNLAFSAYRNICKEHNIPICRRALVI